MKKIISLFQRNYDGDRLVRNEVTPGAEWVLAGEGVPTRKWDGTCCLVREGVLYKRHEVKPGKTPPADFEPANEVDEVTGKQQGWVPVGMGPEDKYYLEAVQNCWPTPDGTHELVGPAVNGNPDKFDRHLFVPHGKHPLPECERTFEGIKNFLEPQKDIEGIVWHHPDGRMVKIKRKDFFKKGT
jgi:hypothetical protein